ncbi:hypothetical protein [[Muricauda] lutisoli]|uniref:Phage tail protein n=1 Tax=[Muricauda] lutisoli TaxID=2816035 RepID=A0ABS3EYD3_9FLAO|nr:hypothetical protein [[Muricauda] lutisoli]MBO0331133.1 hypothetical protein [[Muricauda] lutisoli]
MEKFKNRIFSKSVYDRKGINGGSMKFKYREGIRPVSDWIKITIDMGRSNAKGVTKWLTEMDNLLENRQPTTGMFKTSQPRWTFGDLNNKKHLLIFELTQGGKILNIYYFKDYYPRSPKRFALEFAHAEVKKEGGI